MLHVISIYTSIGLLSRSHAERHLVGAGRARDEESTILQLWSKYRGHGPLLQLLT
jgi:hypothetical protein